LIERDDGFFAVRDRCFVKQPEIQDYSRVLDSHLQTFDDLCLHVEGNMQKKVSCVC
jgi:hypothetical protein